jgi:membrane protein
MAKANGGSRPGVFGVIKRSVRDFLDDDCMTRAAALSYYTVFSLPPLLILILLLASTLLDPGDVRGGLERQLQTLMGPAGGEQVRTMLANAERPGGGVLPTILGMAALLFGATGAFIQLQDALNRAWEVEPDPQQGGFKNFIFKRLLSFGMILSVAFLLLVSLAVSAALTAFGNALEAFTPDFLSGPLMQALHLALSLGVIAALFAAMFKVLPDATAAWRDVWVGAAVTAVLFVVGKFAIGLYIGQSNPGEAYGAAGSLALLLLWIYYSSIILLFGAEFTQAWAEQRGRGIVPEEGARRLAEA